MRGVFAPFGRSHRKICSILKQTCQLSKSQFAPPICITRASARVCFELQNGITPQQVSTIVTLAVAILVIVVVLLGPVFVGAIERNVELFFLAVGILTASVLGRFDAALVWPALT